MRKMKKLIKAQTMFEYLAILIVIAMAVGFVAKRDGVFTRGLQSGLDQIEQGLQGRLPESVDGSHSGEIIEHTPESLGITVRDAKSYEGRPYFEHKQYGDYYFHEGQSDMSSVPLDGNPVAENVVKPESVTRV